MWRVTEKNVTKLKINNNEEGHINMTKQQEQSEGELGGRYNWE
jgi:hypothetical protein